MAKISSTVDGLESSEVETPKFSGEYTIFDPKKILLEDTIQHIETTIEQNGAILIPGILRRFPNSFGRIRKNKEFDVVEKIEAHLKEAFDNLSVSKYDLFRPKNKTDGTSITGHPYLQETSPFTWLIRKKSVDVSFNPRKRIPDALLQFIYSHIIEDHKDCWTIVGDETGDLGEFMGKEPLNHQASMGWVVIPPKSDLPSLPSSFHVSDRRGTYEHSHRSSSWFTGSPTLSVSIRIWNKNRGCPLRFSSKALEFLEGYIAPRVKQNLRTLEGNTEG